MDENSYKVTTKETFDSVSDEYMKRDQEVVAETFEVKKALEQFIKLLPVHAKVLDIGSGGGRDSRFLFGCGLNVQGIDFSEKMVEGAKKIQPAIDYQVMDFEHLDFSAAEFDGIWADASLHHIPKAKLPDVLVKIYEILKKEGLFFIKVKHGQSDSIRENEKFGKVLKRYFAYYESDELVNFLSSAGFTVLDAKVTTGGEWLDVFAKK